MRWRELLSLTLFLLWVSFPVCEWTSWNYFFNKKEENLLLVQVPSKTGTNSPASCSENWPQGLECLIPEAPAVPSHPSNTN